MKIKFSLVVLYVALLGVILLFSSCRTLSSGIVVESYPSTKVIANSRMVAKRLRIIEYSAQKRNELLLAQISTQNITQKDCQFEYRFIWLDHQGVRVESALSTWVPVSLSAKEKIQMKGVAPTKEVEDFIFTVRFVRPSTRW